MSDNKEYVSFSLYVDKEKAKYYNDLKENKLDDEVIDDFTKKIKEDIKVDIESLDEEMLHFRSMQAKWKRALTESYDDFSEKTYNVFEKFDNERPSIHKKIDEFTAIAKPVLGLLKQMNSEIQKISMWNIDKMLDLLNRISQMSVKEKEMVYFLIGAEKKKD